MAPVTRLLALAWVCSLPLITLTRAHVFQSDVTLWADATQHSHKLRPWVNLGAALFKAQRFPAARAALAEAARLEPERPAEEVRIQRAYRQLVVARLTLQEGDWPSAAILAQQLQANTHGEWPPAVQLCQALRC